MIRAVRAIIFDLDNCLAPADEAGRDLYDPAFEAIREANRGTVSMAALEQAFEECWRSPLDHVAQKFGFTQEMLEAGWRVLAETTVHKPLRGYGDLDVLRSLNPLRFLVTSGFRRLQASKIQALGLPELFQRIWIDALGEPDRQGKQNTFATIMREFQLAPEETLIVGDNPESEIAAGNNLGMPTVQILRPGVQRDRSARFHVADLAELRELIG